MTSYGTLQRVHAPEAGWALRPVPHVALRVKRIFPRIRTTSGGADGPALTIKDTPEVAHELLWVMDRWPFLASVDDLAYLRERASAYEQTRSDVEAILAGYVPPDTWRDTALPPRDYQLAACSIVHRTGRLLLTDELGLGKTVSALLVLRDPEALPAVVVCPVHLQTQWERECERFLPWLTPHVARRGQPYDISGADVLILSYHKLDGWQPHLTAEARTVIFDEAQELRRNTSQKYQAAQAVARSARYRVGLTATPVYNYGDEIHSVISVLDADVLGSRDEFLREWCGGWGSGGGAKVSDPKALGTYLRDEGVMLGRSRSDVGRELPPAVAVEHVVDIDSERLADEAEGAEVLARQIMDAQGTPQELWRASGDLDWRLRHATGVAKAKHVAAFVSMLLETGEAVVLFGWHRSVYDIWMEKLRAHDPVLYTGSETAARKDVNARRFLDGETNLLVMSLRSGAGLDGLQERSKVAVFGELDWSPGVHAQCVGRLRRDGQQDTVVAYYLVAEEGSDPVVSEVLDLKSQQQVLLMDEDAALLRPAPDTGDRVKRLAADFLARRHP